jgi:Fe-S-cluster containining protein
MEISMSEKTVPDATKIFECQRCGACCHNLVRYIPMWNSELGLALFDNETASFSPDLVVPVMVYGHINGNNFNGDNFVIDFELLHQLSQNACPHYTDTGCKEYAKRPTVCRAWPVKVDAASFMQSNKINTQMNLDLCPHAEQTLPTDSLLIAAERFAQHWAKLSDRILAYKRSVYVIDVHRRVRYKLTKWLDVPLKD